VPLHALDACVGVHCTCARFIGMFVYACRFCQACYQGDQANRVIEHKALCVCVSGPCFLFVLFYFCSRVDMLVKTHKRHRFSSVVSSCPHAHTLGSAPTHIEDA